MLQRERWDEIEGFFMAQGKVFQALENLARSLEQAGIAYVVIGGMAMAAHGFVRPTEDIDILLNAEGLEAFQRLLVGRGYVAAFPGASRKFKDVRTNVEIEILTAGGFPGDGKPKPVCFPDPIAVAVNYNGIQVIELSRLIELKLASGMTARGRLRDLADVQDMIQTFKLEPQFSEQLDPYVQAKYLELWNDINS